MSILRSLKSDLLDRRLLPILLLLGLAVVGAIAYTILDGGSGAKQTAAASSGPAPVSHAPTLTVTQAPANPNAATAETTYGTRYQHKHGTHNPFVPLATPTSAKSSSAKSSASSAKSASASSKPASGGGTAGKSGSSTPSGGGTTPTQPASPSPAKPKRLAHKFVAELGLKFGLAGSPQAPAQLVQYEGVKAQQELPTSKNPLIVFARLGAGRKSAIFTLSREAIVKGPAVCRPSATQCEAIDLQPGQSEELSYLEPTGVTVNYELLLQSIDWHESTVTVTASAARRRHHR